MVLMLILCRHTAHLFVCWKVSLRPFSGFQLLAPSDLVLPESSPLQGCRWPNLESFNVVKIILTFMLVKFNIHVS